MYHHISKTKQQQSGLTENRKIYYIIFRHKEAAMNMQGIKHESLKCMLSFHFQTCTYL